MKDLAIALEHRPGALAEVGEALGRAGVSVAGIGVVEVRDVLVQRLDPAGANIEVLYSDHANRLILVVDDEAKGRPVSEAWRAPTRNRASAPSRSQWSCGYTYRRGAGPGVRPRFPAPARGRASGEAGHCPDGRPNGARAAARLQPVPPGPRIPGDSASAP